MRYLEFILLFVASSLAQMPLGGITANAGAGTGPTFVQAQNCTINSSATCTSSAFAVTGGNALVVVCLDATGVGQTFSVSDGVNTFTQIGTGGSYASQGTMAMFYAKNITGGTRAITCTMGSLSNPRMIVAEISNVSTTAPLDGGPSTPPNFSNCGATTTCSTTLTTTVGSEILISALANSSANITITAPTGYTIPTNGQVPTAPNRTLAIAYRIVGSIQTGVTLTWSLSPSDGSGTMVSGFHN